MVFSRFVCVAILVISLLQIPTTATATATPAIANPAFQNLWDYSDLPVANNPQTGRGYTWGPHSFGILEESYQEAPNGRRQVQYFDKSRMELSADGKLVTNGLLTIELVSGQRQDGDATYTQKQPSTIQIVGDDNRNGANQTAPTYASFKKVFSSTPGENRAEPATSVRLTIDHDGRVGQLPSGTGTATVQTTIAYYDPVFGHNVPKAFVDFMQLHGQVADAHGSKVAEGPVYTSNPTANVFGYAISEPYWTQASVAGRPQSVMVQLFERRVLTYTPGNADAFKVEMGNIGQHYYQWRYGTYPLSWMHTEQDSTFQHLAGIALDSQANVYSIDADTIVKLDTNGKLLTRWGSTGSNDGQFQLPSAITVDSDNNVYVLDSGNSRVEKFDSTGHFLLKWGNAGTGPGQFPQNTTNLVSDAQNNIYTFEYDTIDSSVASGNSRVQQFNANGQLLKILKINNSPQPQQNLASSMTADRNGRIYIVFNHAHGASIGVSDINGNSIKSFSPAIASSRYLMTVDSNDNLYLAEYYDFIFAFKSDGSLLLQQNLPSCCITGMAVDQTGAIYVTTYNNRSGTLDYKTTVFKLNPQV
jgi:hypothetical protein